MSHEIVDAETFYPGVDLSGKAEQFIRAFFIEDVRPSLSAELRDMAVKQREAFDILNHAVYKDSLGSFDILGGYSKIHGLGHLYIFDRAVFITLSSKEKTNATKKWRKASGRDNKWIYTIECSEAMRHVPEPLAPGKAPFKWLKKEVRSKFLKTPQENKEQYVICLHGAAYNMALEFKMATQGV